ncbi:MAG: alcohol dehydrogenase catalytic domain-containing protein, partial [Gammaproteobacteria bacterium]
MDAVVYTEKGTVQHAQIAEPEAGPGEVIVRMKASGMCHTDLDILHGRYGTGTFPLVPGHEYAGVIEASGDGVVGLQTGDLVVVDPNIHCGACRSCAKGQTNLCENLGGYGTTRNGGFGEFSVVRADHAVAVADMPADRAALAEPVGCVLNGLSAVDTEGAESALVFGAGPIGMFLALALRARGVHEVTMVELQDDRLELADSFELGTVHANSDRMTSYRHGVDIVIDATGVAQVAERLTRYAANGGSVLMFGVCPPG